MGQVVLGPGEVLRRRFGWGLISEQVGVRADPVTQAAKAGEQVFGGGIGYLRDITEGQADRRQEEPGHLLDPQPACCRILELDVRGRVTANELLGVGSADRAVMTGDHGQPVGEGLYLFAPVGLDPGSDLFSFVCLGKAVAAVVVRSIGSYVSQIDSGPRHLQGVGGLVLEQDVKLPEIMKGDEE